MDDFVIEPGFSVEVPSMLDYFGLWAVDPDRFRPLVNRYNGINLHAHISSESAATAVKNQSERTFNATGDGLAIFQVNGPMMKRASSMSGGTSTVRLRQQIRQARHDPGISGGMLKMDTPGGTVKGNSDLSDEAARFAAEKPLIAFVEDLTASAGVSVASQATKIIANNGNAMYGSMGTYTSLVDMSGMAEQLGVKVHVIRAGEFKGMGEPGTELTESQLEEAQRIVNRLNEQYLSIIASGRSRSVDSLRALADGRVIFAADAKSHGLIDDIGTFSEAMDELRSMVKSETKTTVQIAKPESAIDTNGVIPKTAAGTSPATDNTKEVSEMEPATIKELKDKFPKADSSWILSQLEANATITDAAISYADHVQDLAVADARLRAVIEIRTRGRSNRLRLCPASGKGRSEEDQNPSSQNRVQEDIGLRQGSLHCG